MEIALNSANKLFDAVGVIIHNFGIAVSGNRVLFRLASRRNSPLTSNSFKRQSQISSEVAALRKGSKIVFVVANLPSNPSTSGGKFVWDMGENQTSISLTSPATLRGA